MSEQAEAYPTPDEQVERFLAEWEVTVDPAQSIREIVIANLRDLLDHIYDELEVVVEEAEEEGVVRVAVFPLGSTDKMVERKEELLRRGWGER